MNHGISQNCDIKGTTKDENIQQRDTQPGNISNYVTSQNCDTKDSRCEIIQQRDNQLDNFSNNDISQNCDIRDTNKREIIQRRDNQPGNFSNNDISQNCDIKDTEICEIIQRRDTQLDNLSNYDISQNCDRNTNECEIIQRSDNQLGNSSNYDTSQNCDIKCGIIQQRDTQLDNFLNGDISQNCDIRDTSTKCEIIQQRDTQLDKSPKYDISQNCDIKNTEKCEIIQRSDNQLGNSSNHDTSQNCDISDTNKCGIIQQRDTQLDNFLNCDISQNCDIRDTTTKREIIQQRDTQFDKSPKCAISQNCDIKNTKKCEIIQRCDNQFDNCSNNDISQNCDIRDTNKCESIQRRDNQLGNFSNNDISQNCDIRDTSKCENIQRRDNQPGNFSNSDISQNCDIRDTTICEILQQCDTQLDKLSNYDISQNSDRDTNITEGRIIQRRDNQIDNFFNYSISQNCDNQDFPTGNGNPTNCDISPDCDVKETTTASKTTCMQIGDTKSDNLTNYDNPTSQNCDKRNTDVSSRTIQICDTLLDNLTNYNILRSCEVRDTDTDSRSTWMGNSQGNSTNYDTPTSQACDIRDTTTTSEAILACNAQLDSNNTRGDTSNSQGCEMKDTVAVGTIIQTHDIQPDNFTLTDTSQDGDKKDTVAASEVIQTCDTVPVNLINNMFLPDCDTEDTTISGPTHTYDTTLSLSRLEVNADTNAPVINTGGFLPSFADDLPSTWLVGINQDAQDIEANYNKQLLNELEILDSQDTLSFGSVNITELGPDTDTCDRPSSKGVADFPLNKASEGRQKQQTCAKTSGNSYASSKQIITSTGSSNTNCINKTKKLRTRNNVISKHASNPPSIKKVVTNDDQKILLELEAKRLKTWERKVLLKEKEIEKKTAEITDRSKQIAHIQSYVCQLEEKIKKAEENERFYKTRLAARSGQENDQRSQPDNGQFFTPALGSTPDFLVDLNQRINRLELEMLQQRVLRLEMNDTSSDNQYGVTLGSMSNLTSQTYCRCKHPGNNTIPTNEVYSNKTNRSMPCPNVQIKPQHHQVKAAYPGSPNAVHSSMKTSQQHGKYKPIRQPAQEELNALAQTLIDNCKARISMYPNNYQASNLQLSCELTTELEMAAELEMLDNNNDNIIGHASMGTPRTEPQNGYQPTNLSQYPAMTTVPQKPRDFQHLQALNIGNLSKFNASGHKQNSNFSEYITQLSVTHNNTTDSGLTRKMNHNTKSTRGNVNTEGIPHPHRSVVREPMEKHADNGSVHGAARLELCNDHQPPRLNDSQNIHGDTHYETTHVEDSQLKKTTRTVDDSQLKKTTRTVDNKTFSYHSSRSQIKTTVRNDDGKRKEDRYLYPANNYNLINLSPCGRSTGAIPKRHTTPKRRRIPRRRNHHQQNNHVMSKSNDSTPKRHSIDVEQGDHSVKIKTKPGSNHPTTKTPFLGLGRASTGRPWRVCNNQ